MAFDWSKVGSKPAADEFELSVFGPGFGECILMHVGDGRWVIVDSCVDSSVKDKTPVAEQYLRAIGVDPSSQVDLIVATHWHSDHVRGIGRLAGICKNATFCCSLALLKEEFIAYAEEIATGAAATNGAKLDDFREAYRVIHERQGRFKWAGGSRRIYSWGASTTNCGVCEITCLSPSDGEIDLFLRDILSQSPMHGSPKLAASTRTPNLASVVLHLGLPEFAVLLGADMETHHHPFRGWTAAIEEAKISGLKKAAVLKVPHHGSATGHHDQLWSDLMQPAPYAIVTPFNRLPDSLKLPTDTELKRISSFSRELLVSGASYRSASPTRDKAVDRSLKEVNIVLRSRRAPLGLVRKRKALGQPWSTALFPPAWQYTTPL